MMTFSLGTGKVHSLAFSPTGDRLAVGIANRDVVLIGWPNTESRVELTRQPRVAAAVRMIAFSPDGKELAGVYSQQEVAIWAVGHRAVPHMVWNTKSRSIESVVGLWYDLARNEWVTCATVPGRGLGLSWGLRVVPHRHPIARFRDGTTVSQAWSTPEGSILTRDVDSFFKWDPPPTESTSESNQGSRWGPLGWFLHSVWSSTLTSVPVLPRSAGFPARLVRPICAFWPDYRTVLTAAKSGYIRRMDLQTGEELACWRFPMKVIYCLAVSPDGTVAAAGSNHGRVLVWDLT